MAHRAARWSLGGKAGREVGAVADRSDLGDARRQVFVDDDAVLDREPGIARKLGVGHDPDADQHEFGRQHPAVGRLDRADPAVGSEDADDPGSERDRGAPADMRPGEKPRCRRRHHPPHRLLRHLDDVDGDPGGARHRGEFEPDKAGADHDHLAHLAQPLTQDVGVGQRAQRQNALELGTRHPERPKPRPGGEHDMVAVDLAARGQLQATPAPVDRGNTLAGDEVDPMCFVKCLRPQPQFVEPAVAGKIGFRQRRALVGQDRLVADQQDAA